MKCNQIILSICIPTYNRGQDIYDKVNKILSYNKDNIEVVVCDNASLDNTADLLSSIKNPNFVFLQNKENMGTIYNGLKVLDNANGKYAMFAIDKDFIELDNIDYVLDYMQKKDFSVGYFDFKCDKGKKNNIKESKTERESFKMLGYLSKHPTGYVFNNSYLKDLNILENFIDYNKVGAFSLEFIVAELLLKSYSVIFQVYCCKMWVIPTDGRAISLTYSGKNNNLYFMPKVRLEQFEKYIKHIKSLDCSYGKKKIFARNLLKKTYKQILIGYAKKVNDKNFCDYYNTPQEVIAKEKLKELSNDFFDYIEKSQTLSSIYTKFDIYKFKLRWMLRKNKGSIS